jgi:CheY-like chemotaxis protein
MNRAAASEFEHFFFTPALTTAFATHPPLPIRIARIENRSQDDVSTEFLEMKQEIGRERIARMEEGLPADPPPSPSAFAAAAPAGPMVAGMAAAAGVGNWRTRPASQVRESLSHLGDATPDHLAYARTLISTVPESIQQSVHDQIGARAVTMILLVSTDPDVRKIQADLLQNELDEPTRHEVARISGVVRRLVRDHPEVRLVLVDMAMPALGRMEKSDIREYLAIVERMVKADGRLDRFEWLLGRLLRSHFANDGRGGVSGAPANRSLSRLAEPARLVLAMIAWSGTRDEEQAHQAFRAAAGAAELGDVAFPSRADCSVARLDQALDRLERLRFRDRSRLLDAAVEGVCADGHAKIEEVEVLRALASALSCPMPPVLPS